MDNHYIYRKYLKIYLKENLLYFHLYIISELVLSKFWIFSIYAFKSVAPYGAPDIDFISFIFSPTSSTAYIISFLIKELIVLYENKVGVFVPNYLRY